MLKKLIISNLNVNEQAKGIMLVLGINERKAASGSTYCVIKLSDGERVIEAKCFDTTADSVSHLYQKIVLVTISAQLYRDNISYIITDIAEHYEMTTEDIDSFLIKTPIPANVMYDEILRILDSYTKEHIFWETLNVLVKEIYEKNKTELLRWSAAKSIHHSMIGGLLFHTYTMMIMGTKLADIYPSVDMQLLLAAIALHDIGKLRELYTDKVGNTSYTTDGQLLGHSVLGIKMIDEVDNLQRFDDNEITNLKHCIAAHHGSKEFGAIVVPQTIEAHIVHCLDSLDAKAFQFEQAFETIDFGEFTKNSIYGLGDIHAYKPSFKAEREWCLSEINNE